MPKHKSSWWPPPAGSGETHLPPSSGNSCPKCYWQPEGIHLGSWYISSFTHRSTHSPDWTWADHKWLQHSSSGKRCSHQPSQEKKTGFTQGQAKPEGKYGHVSNVSSRLMLSFISGWYSAATEGGWAPLEKKTKSIFAQLWMQWMF